MGKVFPNSSANESPTESPMISPPPSGDRTAEALTVWRKSLLFNCKGFTVFDSNGNLVFRVDNYPAASNGEIVLMDAVGKPLLTIRRKRLSLGENWLIYDGEEALDPRFSIRKHVTFLPSSELAHVTACGSQSHQRFSIDGSYSKRQCTIRDCDRKLPVAEILRKEAAPGVTLGDEVFRLVLQPELDPTLAMAMVLVLDQMYGS